MRIHSYQWKVTPVNWPRYSPSNENFSRIWIYHPFTIMYLLYKNVKQALANLIWYSFPLLTYYVFGCVLLVSLFVCLFVYLSVCFSICLSVIVCLTVYLSLCLFASSIVTLPPPTHNFYFVIKSKWDNRHYAFIRKLLYCLSRTPEI